MILTSHIVQTLLLQSNSNPNLLLKKIFFLFNLSVSLKPLRIFVYFFGFQYNNFFFFLFLKARKRFFLLVGVFYNSRKRLFSLPAMTEVLNPNHSPTHFSSSSPSPTRVSSSSSSSSFSPLSFAKQPQNEDNNNNINNNNLCECESFSSHIAEDGDSIASVFEEEEEEEEEEDEECESQTRDQLSLLALLVALFRKSLIACKSDRRKLCAMEIGWPTNVRHVAHVTFDRFNGFLGLPVEFEPEVPRRPPSARFFFFFFFFFLFFCENVNVGFKFS